MSAKSSEEIIVIFFFFFGGETFIATYSHKKKTILKNQLKCTYIKKNVTSNEHKSIVGRNDELSVTTQKIQKISIQKSILVIL